jgi:hypothetical protein
MIHPPAGCCHPFTGEDGGTTRGIPAAKRSDFAQNKQAEEGMVTSAAP